MVWLKVQTDTNFIENIHENTGVVQTVLLRTLVLGGAGHSFECRRRRVNQLGAAKEQQLPGVDLCRTPRSTFA